MSSPAELARWQQIEHIYHSALQLHKGEREAFLAQVCGGDDSLHEEVLSLIAAYESSGSFMDKPAMSFGMKLLAHSNEGSLIRCVIGPYEILSLIGRGGMGDVYLAQDSRLGRKIAFKLLPSALSDDDNSIRRFEQEARSASAISHPNIAHIYDVGVVEERHYMTMEFVDGVTLRQHLKEGPIELWMAIDIALQVGAALAAAHASGIVHRDIKPENIMLRRDGYIKVLDFGLAKLTEQQLLLANGKPDALQIIKTEPGIVMGTASYMSPEQARGLAVDTRSDIWSMGCVLYEMVAGKLPFSGATKSDLLVSILEREPVPLTELKLKVPFGFWQIVKKALRKNLEARYQTVEELIVELKQFGQRLGINAKMESSAVARLNTAASTTDQRIGVDTLKEAAVVTGIIRKKRLLFNFKYIISKFQQHRGGFRILGILFIVILSLIVGQYLLFNKRPAKPTLSFKDLRLERLGGSSRRAAISPDGKTIAFSSSEAGQQRLWVKQGTVLRDLQVGKPDEVVFLGLTFSPDSNYIFYVIGKTNASTKELYQIPVWGGSSKIILGEVDSPVTFSPDGKQLAFIRSEPESSELALIVANADGMGERRLGTRRRPQFYENPAWSPDGKIIAVSVRDTSTSKEMSIAAITVEDGLERPLTPKKWMGVEQIAWQADGSGLVLCAMDKTSRLQQLWHLSYPEGTERRITSDFDNYAGVSIARGSGDLVTVRYDNFSNIWIVPDVSQGLSQTATKRSFIKAQRAEQITLGMVRHYGGTWAFLKRIVYSSEALNNRDIWIMDQDGRNQKPLTTNAGGNFQPTVSPDFRHIVFVSDREGGGKLNLWRMSLDGENPKQLTNVELAYNPDVTPDGEWVVYVSSGNFSPTLWKVPIEGGKPVQITDKFSVAPDVSPDGKFIACYYWDETTDSQVGIAIIPFEGGAPIKKFNLSTTFFRWTSDGRGLAYVNTRDGVSNIWVQPISGGKPLQVTDFKSDLIFSFDLSLFGDELVCTRGAITSDVILIKNLR